MKTLAVCCFPPRRCEQVEKNRKVQMIVSRLVLQGFGFIQLSARNQTSSCLLTTPTNTVLYARLKLELCYLALFSIWQIMHISAALTKTITVCFIFFKKMLFYNCVKNKSPCLCTAVCQTIFAFVTPSSSSSTITDCLGREQE